MRSVRAHLLFNARLQMLLVLAIIIAANVWSQKRFFRLDLTANNVHSLAPATRALVSRLDKPLVAKVYFTAGLQAPYNNHEQTVVDALNELAAARRVPPGVSEPRNSAADPPNDPPAPLTRSS